MEIKSEENSAPAGRCEFLVDTVGHCFLCFDKIEVSASLLTPTYSLHYICHYLKFDKRKVFNETPIPHQKLVNVNKAKLYVALCKGCAATMGKFNRLFRKLEGIQMGILKCLDKIKGEMGKRGGGKEGNLPEDVLAELDLMDLNKIVIAQRFRRETIEKCSRMLDKSVPRVKLEMLMKVEVSGGYGEPLPNSIDSELIKQEKDAGSDDITLSDTVVEEVSVAEERTPVIKSSVSLAAVAVSAIPDLCPGAGSNDTTTPAEASSITANPIKDENKVDSDDVIGNIIPPPNSNPNNCQLCDKTLRDSRQLARHNQRFHATGNAECNNKTSSNGNAKTLDCRACGKTFYTLRNLTRHHDEVHLKKRRPAGDRNTRPKPTCHVCRKQYRSNHERNRHIRVVHLRKERQACAHCNTIFLSKQSLNRHVKRFHSKYQGEALNNEKCNLCGRLFSTKHSLNQHVRLLHSKLQVEALNEKCNLCGRLFSSKQNLERHILEKHTRSSGRMRIACNLCNNKYFESSFRLKVHYEGFHFKQGYMCDLCPKSYTIMCNLDRHRKTVHFRNGGAIGGTGTDSDS